MLRRLQLSCLQRAQNPARTRANPEESDNESSQDDAAATDSASSRTSSRPGLRQGLPRYQAKARAEYSDNNAATSDDSADAGAEDLAHSGMPKRRTVAPTSQLDFTPPNPPKRPRAERVSVEEKAIRNEEKGTWTCRKCYKEDLKRPLDVHNHFRTCPGPSAEDEESNLNDNPLRCNICRKTFKTREQARRHASYHEKKKRRGIPCEACNLMRDVDKYAKHLEDTHSSAHNQDSGRIKCVNCDNAWYFTPGPSEANHRSNCALPNGRNGAPRKGWTLNASGKAVGRTLLFSTFSALELILAVTSTTGARGRSTVD
ncbi:hypothetical protein JCM16303_003828 [Sporobolomyces ruberrimus]